MIFPVVALMFMGVAVQSAALVAQTSDLTSFLPLLNTSALGVFLFGFYREWWVTGGTNKRAEETIARQREQISQKDEEIKQLNGYFQNTVIPAIIRFTDREASRAAGEIGRSVKRELDMSVRHEQERQRNRGSE